MLDKLPTNKLNIDNPDIQVVDFANVFDSANAMTHCNNSSRINGHNSKRKEEALENTSFKKLKKN